MTSSSKLLAVMEHRVAKGHQSFFQVLVQALKAGYIEGRPVLSRLGVFVEQPSPVNILLLIRLIVKITHFDFPKGCKETSKPMHVKTNCLS